VIIGVETHVCVPQTAIDLYHEGKEVYIVADCVGSRHHNRPRLGSCAHASGWGAHRIAGDGGVRMARSGEKLSKAVSREFLK
jgi:nicotinamidase-related amidase